MTEHVGHANHAANEDRGPWVILCARLRMCQSMLRVCVFVRGGGCPDKIGEMRANACLTVALARLLNRCLMCRACMPMLLLRSLLRPLNTK